MKAIIIREAGGPAMLEYVSQARPTPGPGQVLLRVAAAGVNRPDVLMRQGKYAGATSVAGLIPGLEVAGHVEACGPDVTRWQPGDAVCALLGQGGYAEYAVVDARHCLPVRAYASNIGSSRTAVLAGSGQELDHVIIIPARVPSSGS